MEGSASYRNEVAVSRSGFCEGVRSVECVILGELLARSRIARILGLVGPRLSCLR